MRIARAILQSTQGRIVLAGVLVYAAWQGMLGVLAPGKVNDDLRSGKSKVNVQVTLPFTPDRFHVMAMQRYGRVSGTDERSIEVRGVKQADLSRLARPYWVSRVEALKGD